MASQMLLIAKLEMVDVANQRLIKILSQTRERAPGPGDKGSDFMLTPVGITLEASSSMGLSKKVSQDQRTEHLAWLVKNG